MKRTISKLLTALAIGLTSISASAALTNYGNVTLPFTHSYGNSLSAAGSFVDDYQFTFSPAGTFNTISATFDLANILQITGLQARLYQGAGPFTSGSTPLIQAWSTPISAAPGTTGELVVINPILLGADTYTLEIRGNVQGLAGGSYGGALNVAIGDVTAVPEPESYALMLAGLAMIGGMVVRRRKMV